MEEKVDFSFEVEEELWEKFKEICKREGVEPDAVVEAYLRAVIECRGIPSWCGAEELKAVSMVKGIADNSKYMAQLFGEKK